MIHRNMEFFNVAEIETVSGSSAVKFHRFPEEVRNCLGLGRSSFGRYVAGMTTGCELRFVTEGDRVSISVSSQEAEGEILVFRGDFFHSIHTLPAGLVKTIQLTDPAGFGKLRPEVLQQGAFSPNVWRILFCHDFTGLFHGIQSFGFAIRPPAPTEVPKNRWLAYGSSITHGAGAQLHTNSWIMQAAGILGVDVLDKGMGGSCFCEPDMAEYLAESGARGEWDFTTLELGVNMRGHFSPEEFEQYAGFLVHRIKELNPDKPLFLITSFPNAAGNSYEYSADARNEACFNQSLRNLQKSLQDCQVHLIEGDKVLDRFSLLSCDLIHPSANGHIAMGRNMAGMLAGILY